MYKAKTSWGKVGKWYNKLQGQKGNYFYEQLIVPGVLKLLRLRENETLLDIGCGQGVFERSVPAKISYTGTDISSSLIELAKKQKRNSKSMFQVADATRPLPIKGEFNALTVILALQNMDNAYGLFGNIYKHLAPGGRAVIVLNHPYFRIPRQSSWGIDEQNKQEYRRVNRYQNFLKIPVNMEPGKGERGQTTWSFHYPLWQLSEFIENHALLIAKIEEWISPKTSVGKAAKMENLARAEIPLFMAIKVIKSQDNARK